MQLFPKNSVIGFRITHRCCKRWLKKDTALEATKCNGDKIQYGEAQMTHIFLRAYAFCTSFQNAPKYQDTLRLLLTGYSAQKNTDERAK
eukprot:2392486-Amphidinium_carterae.1